MAGEVKNKTASNAYPDAAQIAAWKKEHGHVIELDVAGEKIIVHKPNRQITGMAMTRGQVNALGVTEVVLENCMLYGNPAILEDGGALVGIMIHIDELIQTKRVEVKKL